MGDRDEDDTSSRMTRRWTTYVGPVPGIGVGWLSDCGGLRFAAAPTHGWMSPQAIWVNGSSSASCQSV